MAKELSRSAACAVKTMYAVMEEMKKNEGFIYAKNLDEILKRKVTFTDWENEITGSHGNHRWHTLTQFFSIDFAVAGFIQKKHGMWYLTPEGEEAMKQGAESLFRSAHAAYVAWDKTRIKETASDEGEGNDSKENILNLESLEEQAMEGLKEYIRKKNPYEFQDMVAALLRAMGYHTPFIAPKGKDGGIDVVAYVDPLGAQTPRIKVQVKHKPDTAIPAADVRALLGVLKAGDIALFVTSGTFSPDARNTAINSKDYVRIIDGDEFIDMWQQYYNKMSDEDKNRLPLRRIAFLGSNE